MKLTAMLKGLAMGAGLMYFLDPDQGRRRQALVRDQMNHQLNAKGKALEVMHKDFSNRARGAVHTVQARFENDHPSDNLLMERLRSTVGRHCGHSGGVQIECDMGEVTLSGDCDSSEVEALIHSVKGVRGVVKVTNQLQVHEGTSRQTHPDQMTPAACFAMVVGGAACMFIALGRPRPIGGLLSLLGLGLMAKAFNDTEGRFEARSSGTSSGSDVELQSQDQVSAEMR